MRLITISRDGWRTVIWIWLLVVTQPARAQDAKAGFCDWTLKTESMISALASSQDRQVAAGCFNGDIYVVDLAAKSTFKIGAHSNQIKCMWFSPDATILVTGGLEG